jgi:hypothetical protein
MPERFLLFSSACRRIDCSLIAITNRYGERGQPWRIPRCGEKAAEGSPFTRTAKEGVEIHACMRLVI